MVPQPVVAVLLLFPVTKDSEAAKSKGNTIAESSTPTENWRQVATLQLEASFVENLCERRLAVV